MLEGELKGVDRSSGPVEIKDSVEDKITNDEFRRMILKLKSSKAGGECGIQ